MTDDDMQFLRELINPYDNPTSVTRTQEWNEVVRVLRWRSDADACLSCSYGDLCDRISQSHPRRFLYDIVANARNSVDVDKFDVSHAGMLRRQLIALSTGSMNDHRSALILTPLFRVVPFVLVFSICSVTGTHPTSAFDSAAACAVRPHL